MSIFENELLNYSNDFINKGLDNFNKNKLNIIDYLSTLSYFYYYLEFIYQKTAVKRS